MKCNKKIDICPLQKHLVIHIAHKKDTLGMVFCYQNCSDLLWEKKCSDDREKLLKFEAESQEFWDH